MRTSRGEMRSLLISTSATATLNSLPVSTPPRPGPLRTRPSSTPGAQDDVGDVGVARRRVDARLDRVQLDREVLTEQPAEVIGTDVVRRVEAPRLHVLAVLLVEIVVQGE